MSRKYVFYLYWFFLTYVVVAFVWWCFIIVNQNKEISILKNQIITQSKNLRISKKLDLSVKQFREKKENQYIGEGITLISIIIAGAFFIFRILRKELYIHKKEKNFLLCITHELKTPISTILLNLETLQLRKCDKKISNLLISNSIEEIKRLSIFYDNIMMSSQFEEKRIKLNFEYFNLYDLIQSVVIQFVKTEIDFNILTFDRNLMLYGDKILLELCFKNIIENSIKYSMDEKNVDIIIYYEGTSIILKFSDYGVGIPDEEKRNIFHKFYRVGSEMTRETKGSGIGLFIVKKIIQIHGGKIKVCDNKPRGTSIKIMFDEKKCKNFIN